MASLRYHVPSYWNQPIDHMVLRGAHMELLALLQSGDVDYTIDYKSTVIQDGLSYLELPPEINLGDNNFAQDYQKVVVKTGFSTF